MAVVLKVGSEAYGQGVCKIMNKTPTQFIKNKKRGN